MSKMTAAERNDLRSLIRQRARLMKAQTKERRLELQADFESQLSAKFSYDQDETWKAAYSAAKQAVTDARAVIAERCRGLGIPEAYAPDIDVHWYNRGENACEKRRAELRRAATTRLDAIEAAAKTEIERVSIEAQTELIADGLTSEAAKAFLEHMPSAETLMPLLDLRQVQGLLEQGER